MNIKFCDKCGKKLSEDQIFCDKCGKQSRNDVILNFNEKGKKSNNIFKIVIILILLFGLAITIATVVVKSNIKQQQELELEIENYKLNVSNFNFKVLSSLANLEQVGNDIKSYWYDYIYNDKYSSIEDAVGKALEDNQSLIDEIKNSKSEIDENYRILLILPDEGSSNLLEIRQAIKDLYNDYYDFYNLIIYPSGNFTSFSSKFSSLDNSGVKKYNYLNSLLEY